MNTERMLKLADVIEQKKDLVSRHVRFDMSDYFYSPDIVAARVVSDKYHCGTTACIAGVACILFGEAGEVIGGNYAARILGLDISQVGRLFCNFHGYVAPKNDLEDITREEAVAAIRRMVKEEGKQ